MSPFSSSLPTNEFNSEISAPGVLVPRASLLPTGGALVLLLGSLVAAIALGALYSVVARSMDLVILFPLGCGLALGALLAIPIYQLKIRHRPFVIACALLASTLLIGTRLFCDSLQAREAMIQKFGNSLVVRRAISPLRFFKLYLRDAVQDGLVIGDVGKSSSASDLQLKGIWFWLAQLVNVVCVAAMAVAASLNYASAPFCESCRRWLGTIKEITKVHPDQSTLLVEKLRERDFESAAGIAGENVDEKHQSVASIAACPQCGQSQLKVKTTNGTIAKTVLEMPITATEAERFRQSRAQRL